jgi:hypothetical protein
MGSSSCRTSSCCALFRMPQTSFGIAPLPFAIWLLSLGFVGWRYFKTLKGQPKFERSEVLYQERSASGCSEKNWITRIGGGRYCVRLVVTKEFLWVTTWFPFSLIGPLYDLEHVIPLKAIRSIKSDTLFGQERYRVTFEMKNGKLRTLQILPRKPRQFLSYLGG